MKAYEASKRMIMKMSKTQLAYNMKIKQEFLPMLAGLIPFLTGTVLPALYLNKRGRACHIETDGKGLYLGPTSGKGFETVGNGLYLMKQRDCMTVED